MSDSKKVYEYNLIDNNKDGTILASVWWDGRKIDSDSPKILKTLKSISIAGKTIADGLDFFNVLTLHYRSGYTQLKRIK